MSNLPGANPSAGFPAMSSEPEVVRDVSQPLYQARNWIKFFGIMLIISGIPSALALVGIIPIWQGVLLMQAASSLETASNTGQKYAFLSAQNNLKTFFVMNGIMALLGILFTLFILCVSIVLPIIFGVSLLPLLDATRYY